MSKVKCEDFFIINVNHYADKRLMDKWRDIDDSEPKNPLPKQFYERAEKHVDFFWGLVNKVTGKDNDFWFDEFGLSAHDCLREELADKYNIWTRDFSDGWRTYLIPKNDLEIIEWFKENINLPYKIMKRVPIGHIDFDTVPTWQREMGRKSANKFKKLIDDKQRSI